MKKICVVTATRAEYGLLKPIMGLLKNSEEFLLQVIVTGAHLSPEFGLTYKQIEQDGFTADEKVEMLLSSDTSNAIAKSMGLGMIGYADAFTRLNPDLLIILGDRYEMLAVAAAATVFKIPIAHLHGGEITEGAYDDAIRHAITKLSHLHFTSTAQYRKRVIQMGEQPDRVFHVGAIGLDNIKDLHFLTKEELEDSLNIKFATYNYQVTFHPETLGDLSAGEQFEQLLKAIELEEDSFFVFTKANADTDGRVINKMIDAFVQKHPDSTAAFHSLGTLKFLSIVNLCTAIIGNSSSGIIEAPSLKTPTINIGDRQKGRIQANSVINVNCDLISINNAFSKVKNVSFCDNVKSTINPYGEGQTSNEIRKVLVSIDFKQLLTKRFYNLDEIKR